MRSDETPKGGAAAVTVGLLGVLSAGDRCLVMRAAVSDISPGHGR